MESGKFGGWTFLLRDISSSSDVRIILYTVETQQWMSHDAQDKHLRAPIRMMLFFTFWVCNKPGMGTSRIDYVLCSTSIVSAIQFRWLCTPLHFQTLYVRPVLVPHYISCKLCFRICSVHSAAIITTFVTSNWSKKNREACRAEVVLATIYMTPALRILIEVHQHQGTFTL